MTDEALVREVVPSMPSHGGGASFGAALMRSREARVGAALVLLFVGIALLGRVFAPFSPTATGAGRPLAGPSAAHWLGTDTFGRDILSRVLYGGREIIWIPLVGVTLALLVGGTLGLIAGYRGGTPDAIFTRATDVGLALPPLLILLVIIAGSGSSAAVVVVAVVLVFAPRIGRVVRGAAQDASANEFVDAARARGDSPTSIALREIAPNVSGPVLVELAIRFTHAIIFVATLSFLGVGAAPPSSNWGLMISDGRSVLSIQPYAVAAPAACIALLSIGFNLLADAGAQVVGRDVQPGG